MMGLFTRQAQADVCPQLVRPSIAYARGYKAAVSEGMYDDCKEIQGLFAMRKCIRCLNREGYKHTFWLVRGREFIGSVVLSILPPDGNTATVEGDIRPSMQSNGHGKLMLKLALEKLRELGVSQAHLSVKPENHRSIRVIENNGGIRVGEGALGLNYVIDLKA